MDDLLDSAQKKIDDAAKAVEPAPSSPPGEDASMPTAPISTPPPKTDDTSTPIAQSVPAPSPMSIPPEPAPEAPISEIEEKKEETPTSEAAPSENASAIVDTLLSTPATMPKEEKQENASAPETDTTEKQAQEAVPPPPPKKKRSKTAIVAALLLFLVTLPLTVFYVSQQQQLADVRSRAGMTETGGEKVGSGSGCATNNDCASAYCDPATKTCKSKPSSTVATKTPTPAKMASKDTPTPTKKPTATPTKAPDTCSPAGGKCYTADAGRLQAQVPGCQNRTDLTCGSNLACIICGGSANTPTPIGGGTGGSSSTTSSGAGCSSESLQNCPGKSPGQSCGDGKTCHKADPGTGSDGKPICKCVTGGGDGGDGGDQPTATPAPQCRNIKIYKDNAVVDPTTLRAGDAVVLTVKGDTSATKGRIRVNGGTFTESTTKNASNEYTVDFTIPSGVTTFTIEAEVFISGAWR